MANLWTQLLEACSNAAACNIEVAFVARPAAGVNTWLAAERMNFDA
jgi:hypothetical protein